MGTEKLFVYKMTVDNGGAPCVYNGFLSLAICKPVIRRSADVGSWIFGFGSKKYQDRLIFIARVTEKLVDADYYTDSRWSGRPDRIYKKKSDGKAALRSTAKFHASGDQLVRDVGFKFENSHVVISNEFRYLGKAGTDTYKLKFPLVGKLVTPLMQGHRVNHGEELRRQLIGLKSAVWRTWNYRVPGKPNEKNLAEVCNR